MMSVSLSIWTVSDRRCWWNIDAVLCCDSIMSTMHTSSWWPYSHLLNTYCSFLRGRFSAVNVWSVDWRCVFYIHGGTDDRWIPCLYSECCVCTTHLSALLIASHLKNRLIAYDAFLYMAAYFSYANEGLWCLRAVDSVTLIYSGC